MLINPRSTGAVLPATLILTTAVAFLAVSSMYAATTQARLSGRLLGAADAFWLAEYGLETGFDIATAQTGKLPENTIMQLGTEEVAGKGLVATSIVSTGSDQDCAGMAAPNSIRHHYEIHATGLADHSASDTHIQGFYICREYCETDYCEAVEGHPTKSYWKAFRGRSSDTAGTE